MNVHFAFFVFYVYLIYTCADAAKGLKGPYKSIVQSARKCVKPKPPYFTELPPLVDVQMYNTSTRINLVQVNVTTQQIHKHFEFKIRVYNWDNGKWKFNNFVHSDDCLGPISFIFRLLDLKYDEKNCAFPINQYIIKDIDVNILDHAVRTTKPYGRVLNKIEVFVKTGMIFCYDFITSVVPA